MSAGRYALGGQGLLSYGIESNAYSQASSADTEFGITSEDIEPYNENPQTAMPTGGGGRQPYVQSPDPKEPELDVPTVVHTPDIPYELALGSRTTTSKTNYDEHLITEADRLPTATIRHVQSDLDMVAYYIGAKANLDLEWSQGDPLESTFAITAAEHSFDPADTAPSISPTMPSDVSPYRGHMQGNLTLDDQTGSLVHEVATINGGSWSVDNGLEVQHHGSDGDGGNRYGYSVAETTAADKYDLSLDANITDTDLYEEAYSGGTLLDAEIPFAREMNSGTIVDGVILRANACKVTDGPIPRPGEGVIEGTIQLAPQDGVEIEIREAT